MFTDLSQYPQLANSPYLFLLRNCHRARYAELLTPEEAAAMAADAGTSAPQGGWQVYAELERADIERLSVSGPKRARLTVEQFADGLPVVVISVHADDTSYFWAIPMWESGARDWLRDAVNLGRISLMLNSVDSALTTTLVTSANIGPQADELLRVTEVAHHPALDTHVFHMLTVGLLLMNGVRQTPSSASDPLTDVRVMVAGRGANAVHLMNTFVASHKMAQTLLPQEVQAIQ